MFQTAAYGEVSLNEGMLDEIIANEVLQHVPELTTLENCLKLLNVGRVQGFRAP